MNKLRFLYIITFIGLFFPSSSVKATENNGDILIISSYSPDSRRVQEFVTNFSSRLRENFFDDSFSIESMNIGSVSEIKQWTAILGSIFEKYRTRQVKAIILIGQEAWAASMGVDNMPENIPIFAVNASKNGMLLTDTRVDPQGNLSPQSIDLKELAKKKHRLYGGCLYDYNLHSNIELVKILFPNVDNITFISDNTYGGISLKVLMMDNEYNYPNLSFTYVDARDGEAKAIETVKNLPSETSAIILATWRIDGDNSYMNHNSLDQILNHNKSIPVISLSGIGIGTTAIGGYIPEYSENGTEIADQIIDMYNLNDTSKIRFKFSKNHYLFDKELMDSYGVMDYKLPKDATISTSGDETLQQYKEYISISVVVILLIFFAFILSVILLSKNIVLKHNLQKRESELIIAKEKAEESDRMKSAFLANMSHEIRTPLNAIVGFSSIISEQEGLNEDNKEYQRIISENSELLLALINDILDLSRLEFGNAEFNLSDVNVRDLCSDAMSSTSFTRGNKVESILDINERNCIIETDFMRITQVLNNLISNANKFTESGYIKLSYSINDSENRVYFSVEDTGCGIPLDKHNKIFQRFEKVNDFKQGAGLGLSICKNILSRLNAEIWIDSSYTGGARFIFSHDIKEILS